MLPRWVVEIVVIGLFLRDYNKNMCSSGDLKIIAEIYYKTYHSDIGN